jgi:hypothetical protein
MSFTKNKRRFKKKTLKRVSNRCGYQLIHKVYKGKVLSNFSFFIVSKGRPDNVVRIQSLFDSIGIKPVWVVGKGEASVYKKAGAYEVIEGGKLTPSRNLCLDKAAAAGNYCVQMSDDVISFQYFDSPFDRKEWKKPVSQHDANIRSGKAKMCSLNPLEAAQIIVAYMREHKAKLGGVYPCMNLGFAFNQAPVTTNHFIVGDFIVVDTTNDKEKTKTKEPRFDERFCLKEDYDFTAQHLAKYNAVVRANRMFVKALHRDNPGGAVSDRSAKLEQTSIRLLQQKWPGVFAINPNRKNEVIMRWRLNNSNI